MADHWRWRVLRAGAFRLDGGSMFGVVPKVLWAKLAEPDDRNRIPLQTNCILLENGADRVLVETGYGSKWDEKNRGIFALEQRSVIDALREVGVEAASITHVVVSHLHFDHAGGLTHLNESNQPVLSFVNARVFVQRQEWNDALANRSTMTRTYLRSHLDPVREQMTLIDGGDEILPGLRVTPARGHTWGQQAIMFDDKEGTVAFLGDVMPTANHVGLAFSLGFDMMPHENMLTKKMFLQAAVESNWRLVLDHEPGDPVVRVQPDPEKPEAFQLLTVEGAPRK